MQVQWYIGVVAASVAAAASHGLAQQSRPAQSRPAAAPPTPDQLLARYGNAKDGLDMAPDTRIEVVEAAVREIPAKMPEGPFKPTWESIQQNYQVPQWFTEARFGIFIHWGLYSVAAHHNEWYEKHMYGNAGIRRWHQEKFGADFGYKDFIPLFTAEKFNADEWAELFQKSGARYVTPSAQHHDNFALWDSDVTPFNSKDMGPKRDFIGELATAVRKRNMTYGVTNHGIENITFINPPKELLAEMKEKQTDLFDPKWATFYNVADRTDEGYKKFLIDWAMRNVELIEKYEPAVLWFDNGVDMRFIDPIKLWVAAYYYNRAHQRGQSVTIATKKAAYAPSDDNTKAIGSVMDFEKVGGRSPAGLRPGSWQVHDTIGSTWGYTEGMRISSPGSQIGKLVDTASKNGNYLLNVSPKGDGSIPEDQRNVLLAVGKWLETNGEAIYGTHAWTRFGDGRLNDKNGLRFTVKGDVLYAIVMNPQTGSQVTIPKLGAGTVSNALVLGTPGDIAFEQQGDSLVVTLPDELPTAHAAVVKIEGLTMNEPPITRSGNPEKFAP